MSNHPGMAIPPLSVMGRVGACGRMYRTVGDAEMSGSSSGISVAQPSPLSPRPCKKTTEAVCASPLGSTMAAEACCAALITLRVAPRHHDARASSSVAPAAKRERDGVIAGAVEGKWNLGPRNKSKLFLDDYSPMLATSARARELTAAAAALVASLCCLVLESRRRAAHASRRRNALALELMSTRNRLMHSSHSVSVGRNFVPKPSDVFVVTYPKCGTTWMTQLVHALRSDGDLHFDEITQVAPWDILAYDCGQVK